MEKGYELGGRPFLAVQETSALQDMVFLDLVRTAGLDSLQMSEDEAPEDFAERILGALVTDGNVLKLLGCLIVPPALFPKRAGLFRRPGEVAPRKWTPDLGDETAAFLGDLTAPAHKAQIRSLVLTLLVHFFESGTVSLWTTPTSSSEAVPKLPGETEGEETPSPDVTGIGPRSS